MPGDKVRSLFFGHIDDTNTPFSLAYCQLYLMMAYLFRRFDVYEDKNM